MFKTISRCVLLFFMLSLVQCGSKSPEAAGTTVEDAEKILAARKADQLKNAKKVRKQALKRNLKMQSKAVRKSIKRNAKRQKRRERLIDQRSPLHDF
jgi:gas vesicle protein